MSETDRLSIALSLIAGVFFMIASPAFGSDVDPVRASSSAQRGAPLPPDLVERAFGSIDADAERLKGIFEDIHQNPELGFMETRTAAIVARELTALGYDVQTGIGKTGVVGIMRNGDGPVVMYRADMDANAVVEATGVPYESKVRVSLPDGTETGVAHMCGHDAHTTWLISLAKTMAQIKDTWSGTLVLVAQPAEEPIEGATAMVSDGLYTTHAVSKPDYLLGLHSAPFSTGTVVGSGGTLMAGTEQLDVTFHGVGGHGSSPQYTKDPVLMGAYAITEYQSIVSRVLDPRDPAVITVGAFQGGAVNNVIPTEATLKLNFRFFSENVHQKLFGGVKAISDGIARIYGMPEDELPTISRKGYSSPLANDGPLSERLNAALLRSGIVDADSLLTKFKAVTGSEDVQMLVHGLDGVAIAYDLVGIADPRAVAEALARGRDVPFANHQPTYKVELDAIPFGAKVAAVMVMEVVATR